jgi:hypothetical protein
MTAQQNFKIWTWQKTISFITGHKHKLLDFTYYTPKKIQTVVMKENILLIKVTDDEKSIFIKLI